jgi:flavodoxin I
MKKTNSQKVAIISSHKAKKTSQVVKKILQFAKWKNIDNLDVESVTFQDFTKYDLLILGVPSWFDGELPTYWDELVPTFEDIDFTGVKVAIFGNGDQVGYPENFGDAVGIMAETLTLCGATIVGQTNPAGYNFEKSRALKDGLFSGLILDFENQLSQNESRIKDWLYDIESQLH